MPHIPEKILRFFFLVLAVVVVLAIGINHTLPPEPARANAPLDEFSAARAFNHVQKIGQVPHPIGTAENIKIKDYILSQVSQLGLIAKVQNDAVVLPGQPKQEQVNNIVVGVPGLKPGKAVLLTAHYDSVKTGPGAADDGASVAAMLETLRALKKLPPLQHEVICLFTNGEEVGLLGAHAFIDLHPWVKDVGLVLNFEYRGNRGAFMMFETSDGNGNMIQALAQAVPFIQANSLMYEVYKRLPNDTDFSIFKRANIPGMNFAAIAGFRYYHSPDDRPENLNLGTLQHQGDIMLALVRYYSNQLLVDIVGENRVYFDLAGVGLVNYPEGWATVLAGLLTLMWLFCAVLVYRHKSIRLLSVAAAALIVPSSLYALYEVNNIVWHAVVDVGKLDESIINFDNSVSYAYLTGCILVNLSVLGWLLRFALKRFSPTDLILGSSVIWLIGVLWLNTNGASFVLAWPLLGVLTACLLVNNFPFTHGVRARVLFAGCVPGLLILVPLIINLFVALTAEAMPVIVTLANLLASLLLPVFAIIIQPELWSNTDKAR